MKQYKLNYMSNQNPTVSLSEYQHVLDKRTHNQKELSNHIVRILSQMNLSRIRAMQTSTHHQLYHTYTFVCLTGLPPLHNQYQNILLPGQKIIYSTPAFKYTYQQPQYKQVYQNTSLCTQGDKLAYIISKVPTNNKIIIIFHSFGTYILNNYRTRYGSHRIFGLVDMVGLPVTWPSKGIVSLSKAITMDINRQYDFDYAHDKYNQASRQRNYFHLHNKLHAAVYMKMLRQKQITDLYQNIRRYPGILKLMFIGRKDNILQQVLMNQKAIHYCYSNSTKFDQKYQNNLRKAYFKLYGKEVNNIQQRFIISFHDGGHSVHIQKKLVNDIALSIMQYVIVLDQACRIPSNQ